MRVSLGCRPLPPQCQVAGMCKQHVAHTDTRAQCLRPDPTVKLIQKGIEGEGKMAFVTLITA